MQQNPIAMIEFVAFIGFVIWLFVWQHKPTGRDRSHGEPTRDEQGQLRADSSDSEAGSPGQRVSRTPSGDA